MGCTQGKSKPPQPGTQPSKPLESNSGAVVPPNAVNSTISNKQADQNLTKEAYGFRAQGSGVQGSGIQGSGIQGNGSGVKSPLVEKQRNEEADGGQTVQYRADGASWGNNDLLQSKEGKANNVPFSGFKPTNNQFNPAGSAHSSAKNSQLNPFYGSPGKNEPFNPAALPSETKNEFNSSSFRNNDSLNKKTSELSKNSNYETAKKSLKDDDGFVPQDSVMEYGQTTITDPSKIEVHFHI